MYIFSLFVLILAASGSGSIIKRQDDGRKGILNYLCEGDKKGDMQEICANMCYGVFCQKFSTTMYFDKPSGDTKTERRKKAGCGSSNRCSKSPYGSGYQCDEFPFASTDTSKVDKPVNRCVHEGQNRAQSNVLKQFYYSQGNYKAVGLDGKPGNFRLAFANYGNSKYCSNDAKCDNDGNEYTRDGKATLPKKRDNVFDERDNVHQYYVTERGMELLVPDGAAVGDVVYTPRSYFDGDEIEFDVDYISGPSNGTLGA